MRWTGPAVALLCLIWGSTWIVIRGGLRDLPVLTSAGLRFAIAGLCLALLAPRLARREGGARPPRWLVAVVGTTNFALSYAIVYWCETRLPSSLMAVLWSTFPMLMGLVGHLFLPGERLRPSSAAGFLVGFAGVLLLFATDLRQLGDSALGAAGIALLSPLVSAIGTGTLKRFGAGVSSVRLNRDAMLLAAALLLGAALLLERDATLRWTPRALASLAWLSLAGTLVTFTTYFWLLRQARASRLALISYAVPVVAIALGATFGGEPVRATTLGGTALVLGGVGLVLGKR